MRIRHKETAYVELTHWRVIYGRYGFLAITEISRCYIGCSGQYVSQALYALTKPDCLSRGRSEVRRRNNELKAKSSHPRESCTTLRISYSASYSASRQKGLLSKHWRE